MWKFLKNATSVMIDFCEFTEGGHFLGIVNLNDYMFFKTFSNIIIGENGA